jgi:catechol 2,3-dioxygenase-like lactoylglutathione lyase family enzyme
MIDHTGITVSDMARSREFYRQVLAALGYTLRKDFGQAVGFGVAEGFGRSQDPGGDFWIAQGAPMQPRAHIAFSAADHRTVEAFHAAALQAGGSDNGAPGLRPHYHADYYAAFVLDPDGYNIEAVCHTKA